jgi:hypothetical protein
MNKAYQYKEGELVGQFNIVFVSDIKLIGYNGYNNRRAKFKCHCGKIFETKVSAVKSGHTRSCGCNTREYLRIGSLKHGLYKTPVYNTWDDIRSRTGNKNAINYQDYGGRGISMFPPWIHDFQLFYDYVSALPNFGEKGHTIDRINNDGNYEPGNLRWTTQHIQNTNSRKRRDNTSGYTGVVKCRMSWHSQLKINNKSIHIGAFKTTEQAVTARNNYIIANKLFEYKIQSIIAE